MEDRAHALIAGLFTLILSLAVAVSVWWLSGNREATQDVLLVAKGGVEGLSAQSQVRFRGLRVGKVLSVTIEPEEPHRILVTVRIYRTVPISSSTMAKLNTMGVTGLAYVQLDERTGGKPIAVSPGALPRLDLEPSNVAALSDSVTEIAVHLRQIVAKVNAFFDPGNIAQIDRTLDHLEAASAGLERTLKEAPLLLADMRRALSEDNLKNLHAGLANLAKASGEAAPLLMEARKTLSHLESLGRRLDEMSTETGGEITAGSLPRLNRLMQDVSASSQQLSRVLGQIERSPQSLLFGRPAPAPGPGEPGFQSPK
ncbi:MAG: MlaD family protein [Rhodocyclaceae bacterium]|nr:MlaD family protein [Rhodocyclaceae bacterium]